MKSIFALFGGEPEETTTLDAAFFLGQLLNAHVTCLHIAPDPGSMVYATIGTPMYVPSSIIDNLEQAIRERARKAERLFTEYSEKYHAALEAIPQFSSKSTASFKSLTGSVERLIALHGKYADLLVMGKVAHDRNPNYAAGVIASLFATGRPLLYVPTTLTLPLTDTIAIAWNNSAECARALAASLPLLPHARAIHILTTEVLGSDTHKLLVEYLGLHHLTASIATIEEKDAPLETRILHEAKVLGATLLVMGAFSHSRLYHILMGGMTSFVLDHADIPVLMAH